MNLPKIINTHLQVKFLLLLLTLLIFLTVLIAFVFINYEVNTQRKNLLNASKAFSSLSVRPIGNAYITYFDSGFLKFKEIISNTLTLDPDISKIQIVSVEGQVLFDSSSSSTNLPLEQGIVQSVISSQETVISSQNQVSEIVEPFFDDFGAHPFSVLYFINNTSLGRAVSSTIPLVFLIIFAVAIIAGGLIALLVRRTILSPVNQISQVASKISGGDLAARVEIETGDELEKLASAVNNMASSLQKNIEALKELDQLKDEFIIIASHNLRTPITVLKGYLTQLRNGLKSPKQKEPIESMTFSVSQLEGLTEELLNIVSLEKNKTLETRSKVNLVTVLQEVISFYSHEALEKKVTLHFVSNEENYFVDADISKLKVAFSNLIENAIKFNKKSGSVTVKIVVQDGNIVVSVVDTGIGIAENQLPLVFKKFHRATDILRYNYQGLGLGLYLARVIIEAHHGKIWFESRSGEGSTFYVSLPVFVVKGGEG